MKSRIKLAVGVFFAAIAALTVSLKANYGATGAKESCYSDSEVELLMRSNHWSRDEAKKVLDLICEYSKKP